MRLNCNTKCAMLVAATLLCVLAGILAGVVSEAATRPTADAGFVLRSPCVSDGGDLPKEFTGDGEAATLPLEWSGAPAGTRSFALIMHHIAPDKTKWYWIIYDIPASVTSLPRNVCGVGIVGTNGINGRTEYAPPHSRGPGPKTYVYTVYALSLPLQLDVKPSEVTRDVLLEAMKGKTLGKAEMRVVYTRPVVAPGGDNPNAGTGH